jgi:hypothetical protein
MRTKILYLLLTLTTLVPMSSVIGLTDAEDSPYNHLVEIVPMEHGYIRSNGTVEPASLPIERTGNYYLLKDHIVNHTIEIQSSNIIFDGNTPASSREFPLTTIILQWKIGYVIVSFQKYSLA